PLPGADPVRAFVLHDDRGLAALAEASRDELGALLVLLRRAEEHDYPGWLAWVQAHYVERPFAFPVLKSALELNAFLPNRVFPEVMPYLVLTYLFRETADTSWTRQVRELDLYTGSDDAVGVIAALIGRALRVQAGDLVLRFEGELELAGEHYRGPVLDADTYAAFYAGYFYSALWASAQFRLDQLASVPAAEEFARTLPGDDMPRPAALARLYRHRIDARAGDRLPRVAAPGQGPVDRAALPEAAARLPRQLAAHRGPGDAPRVEGRVRDGTRGGLGVACARRPAGRPGRGLCPDGDRAHVLRGGEVRGGVGGHQAGARELGRRRPGARGAHSRSARGPPARRR